MHIVSSARVLSLFTHTHYGRVLTTLGLHVQILDDCFNVQVFVEMYALRGAGLSLPLFILVPSFLLYSCYFMILSLLHSAAFSSRYSFAIMCSLICIIAVVIDYYSSDFSLFRLQFRLSVYTWGIFSSRICVAITSPYP